MAPPIIGKPPYINPAGPSGPGDLPSVPPFAFDNVTTRAFPLKANMAQLGRFCDEYLNVEQEVVRFFPSLPFVYLLVLNYGRMSSASVQAQNIGWVSQHEVAFTIPLECRRREGGRWVFESWASVSPFIFVDDELSTTTGREVYGWPKVAGRIEAEVPLWATDPRWPTRVFSLQVPVFPKPFAGEKEELRDLIQIDRDPVPRFSEFPLDPANPWSPLSILPAAVRSWLNLAGVSLDLALRSPARGYRAGWDWAMLRAILRAGGPNIAPRSLEHPTAGASLPTDRAGRPEARGSRQAERRLSFETITLKQFRDTQKPDQACYQAIIASTMGIERVNGFGLLGDYTLLRGDISGGYTLRIHRYAVQPIIESLGLETFGVEEGNEAPVAILKPVLPFWTDVDLHYGLGKVVCERGQCFHPRQSCTDWRFGAGAGAVGAPPAAAGAAEHPHGDPACREIPRHIPYNTAQGAASQPVAGPFHFPDVTLQVYPLMADCARLQRFLDEYLNQPLRPDGEHSGSFRFEPCGSYAYLLVGVQGGRIGVMWSEVNNIGWWADKEVSFCVPVKWYRRKRGADGTAGWELISLGMVSPFVFGNTGRAVITDREVNGRPTVKTAIDSPADTWLTSSGPIADRKLLRLETEIFPALHLGQRAEQRTLLEIDRSEAVSPDDPDAELHRRAMLDHWGEKRVQDLRRKSRISGEFRSEVDDASALAGELLCLDAPFNSLHLKQYRDAAEPDKACYQALVKTPRRITRLYDLQEIGERIHIRLYKEPGFPIAETLGLTVKHVDSRGGAVVQVLEPVRPFWMRIGLREDLGEVLCWRMERREWTAAHPWVPGAPEGAIGAEPPFFASGGGTGVFADQPSLYCADTVERLQRALQAEWAALRRAITADPALREALIAERDRTESTADGEAESAEPGGSRPAGARRRVREVLRALLDGAGAEAGADDWSAAVPARELYPIVEGLAELFRNHGKALESDRLSRERARRCIDRLPEIQAAIESLLARSGASTAPEHFIPRQSLPAEWVGGRLDLVDEDFWTEA